MNRHWTAFLLAGCLSFQPMFAQQADSSGGDGSAGTGAGSGAASVLIPPTGGEPAQPAGQSGAAAQGNTPAPAAAAPIVVPSNYGDLPVTLTPGQGRFAAPPFKFSVSLSQGYDDNVFTSPTKTRPALRGAPPGLQPVQIPRIGSAVTNASVFIASQAATPRTAYTLDAVIGGLFYWNRPGQLMDYNDRLEFIFFHRFTPRLSVSTAANLAILSQADYTIITAPTNNNTGNYLVGNAKIDLTYLWAARFSTVASYNLSTTLFANANQQSSNLYENTLGIQFRYLLSPRTTLVAEIRGAADTYPKTSAADSTSQFLLIGFDSVFSPRLRGTLRVGGQSREFQTSNINSQTSPYMESMVSYTYGHQSNITWTNWFGLQPSNLASSEQVSFRTGLGINHVITGRITGSFSLNYNCVSTDYPPPTGKTFENFISCSFGLQYVINRHFTLTATYTFSDALYTDSYLNYYRNQIYLGGTYAF